MTGRPYRRVLPLALGLLVTLGTGAVAPGAEAANAANAPPAATANTPSPGDQAITAAVEDALRVDGIDASALQVETLNGVVTLGGPVHNLMAKERAVEVAEHVRGVRRVADDLDVVAAPRTDEAITADVVAAMRGDRDTRDLDVVASTTDAVVTLTGTVDSWQQREMVEDVVAGVYGVEGIADHIAFASHAQRSNDAIRRDVESALRWNRLLDAAAIHVAVNDGTVALTGTVDSAAQRSLALDSAWVTGVSAVNGDGLEVAAWETGNASQHQQAAATHSDAEIAGAIADAMRLDARVPAEAIRLGVNDGVVTLSGQVETLRAKREADRVATNIVGVARIENDIQVRPNDDLTDSVIKSELDAALARDPWLQGLDIETSVYGGSATLQGAVDTRLERTEAEWVATGVMGVQDVVDNVTVGSHASALLDNPYAGPAVAKDATWDVANPLPVTVRGERVYRPVVVKAQ